MGVVAERMVSVVALLMFPFCSNVTGDGVAMCGSEEEGSADLTFVAHVHN